MKRISTPVYIIHYSKLKDRKLYLDNFLDSNFKDFKFITDFDKEKLKIVNVNETYIEDPEVFKEKIFELWKLDNLEYRKLSDAEISCFFKHIQALREAANSKSDFSLILEDDVIPVEKFAKGYNKMINNLSNLNWDIVFIGSGIGKNFIYKKMGKKVLFSKPQKVEHPASNCADSYIVKRDIAKKLLTNFTTFHLSYDWELAYQMYKLELNVYWATRPLFKQGSKTGDYASALR